MSATIDKLTRARTALVLEKPFFGALALRLKLVEAPWQPTLAVDGTHLYFNPEHVDELPMPLLKGVLAHEVLHCALGHPWRRGERDPEDWNRAADYAINPLVLNDGMKLPDGMLVEPAFEGLSTEQIYARIHRDPPPEDQGQGQDGDQGGAGDDQGGPQGKGDPQGQDDDQDGTGDGQGEGDAQGQGEGQGQTPDGRPVAPDPSGCGGVIDAPTPEPGDGDQGQGQGGQKETEWRQQEQDWKMAAAQAAQLQRAAGTMGADMDRAIRDEMQPKADWRSLLREFLTQASKDDYAWTRPNRRHIASGLYLPSVYSERVGEIVVAIDTSGSISDELVAQFQGELNAILEDVRPERVVVLYCSTEVTNSEEFAPDDFPVELNARGGGGTRFQPVFDWVEERQMDPQCLVYLTDMYPGDAPSDPGYPVIWADYASGYGPDQPFGERVVIE